MNTANATTGATLSLLPAGDPNSVYNTTTAGIDAETAAGLAADANADPLDAVASPIDAAGTAVTSAISSATGITSAGTNTFLNSLSNLLGSTAQTLQWLIIGIAVVVVIWFALPFLEGIRDK